MTSFWAQWRLNSPLSRLFAKLFVQVSLNMWILIHGLLLFVCHFDLKSWSGGRFKNACELLNLQRGIKVTSFNVCVRYFVWNFKGTLWNFTQNISPAHWNICFYSHVKIHEFLDLRTRERFWNAPMVSFQCVNSYKPMWNEPSSVQIMACRLLSTKPSSEPMLVYCQSQP